MSEFDVVEESTAILAEYSRIPMSFEVRSILELTVVDGGLGGSVLQERAVDLPWVKDYDGIEGEEPTRWAKQWDLSKWGVLTAQAGGERIGGCVLAFDTEGVEFLEGRKDLAALWDIRVVPEWRGRGVGTRLFTAALAWARARGCKELKIETQNINVPACRFYAAQGCTLRAIDRHKYVALPKEVELVWSMEIE